MSLTKINLLSNTGAWRLVDEGDGIHRLIFDLPGEKVNKLTAQVLEDLERMLDAISREPAIKALIVWGGKEASGTFIAGADIHEIRAVTSAADGAEKARRGQQILGRLAQMPQVTVAAVHGNCLGGGTELILACDLRVASHSPRTKIGLPETQLGILPGFGGTQRLPRLVGIQAALPVILGGKPLGVAQAARIGLVDRVVYPDLLLAEARALANKALLGGGKKYRPSRPRRPLSSRILERFGWGRALLRTFARRGIERQAGTHYPAPFRALDAVVDGFGLKLEDGLSLEARLVGELIASPISKNLVDLFLSSEEARRGRRGDGTGPSSKDRPRTACAGRGRVALLGAGVMGGGIAALLLQRGFRVRMKDISPAGLQAGLRKIRELFAEQIKKRRMKKREAANYMASVSVGLDFTGFDTADFVIEAVVENLDVKKMVLRETEAKVSAGAILATNTSALSVTEMQSSLQNPARFVGLHFFNPVNKMPLVEVIRGKLSSEDAIGAAEGLARDLGKVPVRVEDRPGFLVNRLLAPYLNEAARLFEEGYSPENIDRALRAFGMPMGPFQLLDEIGLDVAAKVAHVLHEAFGERMKPPASMEKLVAAKLHGKKCGRGFYLHGGGALPWPGKKRRINPEALRLSPASGKGFLPDVPELWVKRLVFPIINEAALALDEKVVDRPSLVDLAMVFGTGFAPFRGGPLRYAEALGIKEVVEFLEHTQEARMKPCELLQRLAREGGKIYDLERASAVLTNV